MFAGNVGSMLIKARDVDHATHITREHTEMCQLLLSTDCRDWATWDHFAGGGAALCGCGQCDNCGGGHAVFRHTEELKLLAAAYAEIVQYKGRSSVSMTGLKKHILGWATKGLPRDERQAWDSAKSHSEQWWWWLIIQAVFHLGIFEGMVHHCTVVQ